MALTAEMLTTEHKNRFADWLWRKRGCPLWDESHDWNEAEELLRQPWARQLILQNYDPVDIDLERWVRVNLQRHYLAIAAEAEPTDLANELGQLAARLRPANQTRAAVVALLDGSPEYGRQLFLAQFSNGLAGKLEAKDAPFYELCYHTFSLHGGTVLFEGNTPPNHNGSVLVPPRKYQDGCAVAFAQPVKAVAATLHLARTLAALNEEENRPWPQRLHCRVAIGGSWIAAVRCLPNAYRGEIVIDQECWRSFNVAGQAVSPAQELLFAAGVRIGPST